MAKFFAIACHLRFCAALMDGHWGLSGAKACCSDGLSSDQVGRDWAPGIATLATSALGALPDTLVLPAVLCAQLPNAQAQTTAANMGLIIGGRLNRRIESIGIFCDRQLQKIHKARVCVGGWGQVIGQQRGIHLGDFIGPVFVEHHVDGEQTHDQ